MNKTIFKLHEHVNGLVRSLGATCNFFWNVTFRLNQLQTVIKTYK